MKTRMKGASDAPRTTPEDRAKLRALAEAVPMPGGDPDIIGRWWDAGDLALHPIGQAADRQFVMAASPDIVRDLLDDLRSAEDERDEIAADADVWQRAALTMQGDRDALRTWQERVALAAGLADEVEGYGVHLEADPDTAADHMARLLGIADTHVECPIYCGDCGEPLADTPCDHCAGSGCGPGTASGAYEECGWCAGAGKVHVGCAHLSYAELCAERDALAAKLDAVRALAEHYAGLTNVDAGGAILRALDATPETGGES